MALALRLFLLLLHAVALPARAAQAAPLQAWRADLDRDLDFLEMLVNDDLKTVPDPGAEPGGEGGAASQATSKTEPLGDGQGVSADRTFQAPLLVPAHKPSSHRRGPLTGSNKATGHMKPHEPSKHMREMLKEKQQAGHGAAGPTARVPDSQKGPRKGFCKGTGCWLELIEGLPYLELNFILCCVGIWCYWKRKQSTSTNLQAWPNNSGRETRTRHQPSPRKCLVSLPPLSYELVTVEVQPPTQNSTLCP